MTGRLIFLLVVAAAMLALGIIAGHRRGRRSCRNEYPDGWDAGQKAERERWEDATGTTWDALAFWQARMRAQPDDDWLSDPSVLPATEVLLAEADVRLGVAPQVPSVADVDELARRYEEAHAPVVADITSAARWRPPGHREVPVIDGRVVTPVAPAAPGAADWDLLAGSTLPAYAVAALAGDDGRPRTVDECIDSMVMRALRS